MRDEDEILAEVFDSLIKQDGGKIPSEVGELINIGLRLHNECPNINPAFLERLGCRLKREWGRRRQSPLAAWGLHALAALRNRFRPRHLPGAALAALTAGLMLLALAVIPGLHQGTQARLSQVITIFNHVEIHQQPSALGTPMPRVLVGEYKSIEEAQAVCGFAPRTPSYLPKGVVLRSIQVDELAGRRRIALNYARKDDGATLSGPMRSGAITVTILQFQTSQNLEETAAIEVGPNSTERLPVAGRPALWVQGQWRGDVWKRASRWNGLMVQDGDLFMMVDSIYGHVETVRIAESVFK